MLELNHVFSAIKNYCLHAPSKGFVSFESISVSAGVSRTVLKTHLESLKKMKLITYSATGQCFLSITKLGMDTKHIGVPA